MCRHLHAPHTCMFIFYVVKKKKKTWFTAKYAYAYTHPYIIYPDVHVCVYTLPLNSSQYFFPHFCFSSLLSLLSSPPYLAHLLPSHGPSLYFIPYLNFLSSFPWHFLPLSFTHFFQQRLLRDLNTALDYLLLSTRVSKTRLLYMLLSIHVRLSSCTTEVSQQQSNLITTKLPEAFPTNRFTVPYYYFIVLHTEHWLTYIFVEPRPSQSVWEDHIWWRLTQVPSCCLLHWSGYHQT